MWVVRSDEWKCCQPPTFNSIWEAAEWTLYWTTEWTNSFQKRMEKGNSKIAAVKKATGEKRNEIKGHSGYVAKPMIKKGLRKQSYCTWLAFIYLENQLLSCLNQFFFCVFQGWKNTKVLAFRYFFRGNNDCHFKEYFAGI